MSAVLHVLVFYMQLYCFGMGNQLLLLYIDAPFFTAFLFLEVDVNEEFSAKPYPSPNTNVCFFCANHIDVSHYLYEGSEFEAS